ncbi:hypothetical protein BD289DRAFT_15435 [Coniella lustricola]|uniref:Uncharacterized protein n=1 Tax=Coniella lustricola TaxID=2025994 RepID=A0A2T3A3Z3_9PEZI|nr:hypothetical protein BD289DRAFT_15435 [Coniella lustricola]
MLISPSSALRRVAAGKLAKQQPLWVDKRQEPKQFSCYPLGRRRCGWWWWWCHCPGRVLSLSLSVRNLASQLEASYPRVGRAFPSKTELTTPKISPPPPTKAEMRPLGSKSMTSASSPNAHGVTPAGRRGQLTSRVHGPWSTVHGPRSTSKEAQGIQAIACSLCLPCVLSCWKEAAVGR